MTPAVLALALQLDRFHQGLALDGQVLKQAYEQMHPGLYRYNTQAQTEAHFNRLEQDFARATDLKQAYVALSKFTATIKCGHTYPNFFNQTKDVAATVFSGQNRVPFHFRWLKGQMVVTRDLTPNGALPKGTVVEKIDGISCKLILKKMMPVARADGSNDAKRISYLSVYGDDRYEAFDIYLPLLFNIKPGSFTLTLSPGKKREVAALSDKDRADDYAAQQAKASTTGDPWNLDIKAPNYAVLTMPSWQMYDGTYDWVGYLHKTFATLNEQHIPNLVIDLRGDEGGSSVGDEIISYLVSRPIALNQYHQYTRYEKIDPKLRPYLQTWDRSFDDWSKWTDKPVTVSTGHNHSFPMYRFLGEGATVVMPRPEHYSGKVYVLVDSSNSSATFEFENTVQQYGLATLVGEPTGGNLRGINGGAFYFLMLPNSHLEVDLPLIGQFPTKDQPDRGLQPDITVYPAMQDIAKGRDVVLEKVLSLMNSAPGTR